MNTTWIPHLIHVMSSVDTTAGRCTCSNHPITKGAVPFVVTLADNWFLLQFVQRLVMNRCEMNEKESILTIEDIISGFRPSHLKHQWIDWPTSVAAPGEQGRNSHTVPHLQQSLSVTGAVTHPAVFAVGEMKEGLFLIWCFPGNSFMFRS